MVPPERLVYTFVWEEPDPDDRPTVVTVTFEGLGDSTAMTVHQGPFAADSRLALHESGWTDSLDKLEEYRARRP